MRCHFLSLVLVALCLDPQLLPASQYIIQSGKTGQGLQARGIATCIIGRDGTTWIGAIGDLIRFDGLRFEKVPFTLRTRPSSNRITALWEDEQERIWCGYETGDVVIYDKRDGRASLLPIKWSREEVRAIHVDPNGDCWIILDDHSLVRARDGLSTGPRNLGGRLAFIRTTSGKLYAERAGSLLEWQKDGSWTKVYENFDYISSATPSHTGGMWIVNPNWERAFHVQDDNTVVESRPLPHDLTSALFLESRSGELLAAMHSRGIVSIGERGLSTEYSTKEGLSSLWVQQMAEDEDGNVIAASYEDISILRKSKAVTLADIRSFGGARLTGVSQGSDGKTWITTEGAGLYAYQAGAFTHFGKEEGLNNPNIWSVLETPDHRLWAGSWGEGLYTGVSGSFAPEQDWLLPQRRMVTALLQASDGTLWAGTGDGLGRKTGDSWTWFSKCGETQLGNVRALATDGTGRLWFGTAGNGTGYVDGAEIRLLDPSEEADSRFVSSLLPDGNRGVWIGTEGSGLFHWEDRRWKRIRTEEGLPSNNIFHIADDELGRLWFTSSAGVFAIQKQELAAFLSGQTDTLHPTTINKEDGLPSNQCAGGSLNAAYLSRDGRYFVPTSGGLAMIDTTNVQGEATRLKPSFVRLLVDNKEVPQSRGEPLTCPPWTQSLQIELSAPTLSHSDLVKFAYKLDGDSQSRWLQLGSNRSLQLQRMSAGLHRLEVIAWSPGSAEPGTIASLQIDQLPSLTETLWFRGLVVFLALAAVAGAAWAYARQAFLQTQRKLELETAIEKERHRIARDIHDHLGVLLAQVMLIIQGAKPGDTAGDQSGLLPRLHTKAKEITKALDELIWTINPSYDTVEGFALYVSRLAQETITGAGIRCRLKIEEPPDVVSLGSGVRHQLIMCMKEALANAIRHSGCSQIEVQLRVEHGILTLGVSDNGSGFEPPADGDHKKSDTDHSGCENMRTRMQELSGRFRLSSSPGKGTQVSFEYPLPR